MGKCWKCNRSGLFLPIGRKSGLCIDCLEIACDSAAETIKKLSEGGNTRKQVLEKIDTIKATEVATKAAKTAEQSDFLQWDTSVHATPEQLSRIRRSASVTIIDYNPSTKTATVAGSGSHTYRTSFSECSCGDFIARRLPCKHMYRLAEKYGGIDFSKHI